MEFELEEYTLKYRPTRTQEVSFSIEPFDDKKAKAINCTTRLIYLVFHKKEILYVGEAKSALKKRLQRGFGSYRYYKREETARGGYKGYKWIELIDPINEGFTDKLKIYAILFSDEQNDKRENIEAVEGDLVFEFRKRSGKWPLYQNEIHFNNDNPDSHRTALEILKEVG